MAGAVTGDVAAAVPGATAVLAMGVPGAEAGAALAAKFIEFGALSPDGNEADEVAPCVAGVLSPAGSIAAEVKEGVGFADIKLGAGAPTNPELDKSPPGIGACAWLNGFNRPSCWF